MEALALRSPVDSLPAAEPSSDVARAAAGDVRAFEELYRTHLPRVHGLVRRMTAGRDADELTQDVFVRVWQKLGTFRGDSSFRTWLHRLAVNVVIERFRTDQVAARAGCTTARTSSRCWPAPAQTRDLGMDFEAALEKAARRRARDLRAARRRGIQAPRDRDAAGDLRGHVEGPAAPRADDAATTPEVRALLKA